MNTDRELARRFLRAMNAKVIARTANWQKYEIVIIGNGTVEFEYWLETYEPYSLTRIEEK